MPVTMLVAYGMSSGICIPPFECTESKWSFLPRFTSADARGIKTSSWNKQHLRGPESGPGGTESHWQREYRDRMKAWQKLAIQNAGAGTTLSHSAVVERRVWGRTSTFSRCSTDSLHGIDTNRSASQVAEEADVSDTRGGASTQPAAEPSEKGRKWQDRNFISPAAAESKAANYMDQPASPDIPEHAHKSPMSSKTSIREPSLTTPAFISRPHSGKSSFRPRQKDSWTKAKVSSNGKGEEDRGSSLVKKVVIALLTQRRDAVAELAAPFMKDLCRDAEAWNQVMKGLEKRGARGRAYQVFQYMVEAKQEGLLRLAHHNFNTIMLILGREGKMRLARSIFDSMADHGCHAGVFTYSALMTGYSKHGLVKEAFEVFEAMKGAGVEANTVTFNILIHACAKTGIRIGKVIQLYAQMRAANVEPDGITYSSMINACVRGGLVDDALLVYEELKKSECCLNVVTYSCLVDALGKQGRLQEASKVFAEMKSDGHDPTSWTYNALINAYGQGGQPEDAVRLYWDMERSGCEPDLVTYNTLLNVYGRGGLWKEAEALLAEMHTTGCAPDRVTYNTLLDAYSKGGHSDRAVVVLEEMQRRGCAPDLYTYTILLDACRKKGDSEQALKIFEDLQSAGHQPNVVAYTCMIGTHGHAGQWEKAEAVWHQMVGAGCQPGPTAYVGLIDAYSHHGMYTQAQSVFDEMVQRGMSPEVRTYTALMNAYGLAGEYRRAEALFQDMQKAGFLPDALTYAVLVRAFGNADKFELALSYFEHVAAEGDPLSELCRQIIQDYSELYRTYTGHLPSGVTDVGDENMCVDKWEKVA